MLAWKPRPLVDVVLVVCCEGKSGSFAFAKDNPRLSIETWGTHVFFMECEIWGARR